jgi:outer membrane protein
MLSKISLGISLLLAVAVIGMLLFISNTSDDSSGQQSETSPVNVASSAGNTLTIAYVEEDSLLVNYLYYQEQQEQFDRKQKAKALRYNQALTEYQNEMAKWQEYLATPGASERDVEIASEDMDARSASIQNMELEMESLALEFNNRIFDKVSDYLDDYAAQHGIDLILNYKKELAVVLYSDSGLNITNHVVEGMNKQYELEMEATNE